MVTPTNRLGISKEPDRFQPSIFTFPSQSDRAGYQPFAMSAILVVPFVRDHEGNPTSGSYPTESKYYVEDAPGQAKVAGVEHRGILIPDFERFKITLSLPELIDLKVSLNSVQFFRLNSSNEFEEILQENAVEGDYIEFTNDINIRGKVIYYPDADYFDLSRISIPTVELQDGRYRFIWSFKYNIRDTLDDQFVCILNKEGLTSKEILVACPGEVHSAMVNATPAMYFDGQGANDTQNIVASYRPLADILQNIFDEQTLLRSINWIDKIPAQFVPYLAYLIGLDLPNFPDVTDEVRKSIVKNGVKLQKLKGTKRALRELFEIFGFTVDLINTWYLTSGEGYVAPGEDLPTAFDIDEIQRNSVCQYDVCLSDYSEAGFGELSIPLLYRPNEKFITLHAYLVDENSATYTVLTNLNANLAGNLSYINTETCTKDTENFHVPVSLNTLLPNEAIDGLGQVLIDTGLGSISEVSLGSPTIAKSSIEYNRDTNTISLNFDGYLDFLSNDNRNLKLFVYAQYSRDEIVLPTQLKDRRSNKFDINITFKDGEIISSNLFDFLINYVIKFKAFHSIIRKIQFNTDISEVYNVLDWCAGGSYSQKPGTDAGEQQVPPAIVPVDPTCGDDRGFKETDLEYRRKVLSGLEQEFEHWKAIDKSIPDEIRPLVESLSNLALNSNPGDCGEVEHGQDRVISAIFDQDHDADTRSTLCDLDNSTDHCYKGRVKDLLEEQRIISLIEYVSCNPCNLTMGDGRYYVLPNGTKFDKLDLMIASRLHKLIKDWSVKGAITQLYFSNRAYLGSIFESYLTPALQRPGLNIKLPFMHFPGHRFPTMGYLEADFTHPTWSATPWDDMYSGLDKECKGISKSDENLLNAQIVIGTDGEEVLIYDEADLVYTGNGIQQDISSMGVHEARDYQVTHSIYTTAEEGAYNGSSPIITLESVVHTTADSIVTADKIFESWNGDCNTDFIDGYPAEIGEYTINPADYGANSEGAPLDLNSLFGLPVDENSSGMITLLFKAGSGIICLN